MTISLCTWLNRDARTALFKLLQIRICFQRSTCLNRYTSYFNCIFASKPSCICLATCCVQNKVLQKVIFRLYVFIIGKCGLVSSVVSGVDVSAQSSAVSVYLQIHESFYVIAFISCRREVIEYYSFHVGSYRLLH